MTNELTIKEQINQNTLTVFGIENFPVEVKKGINEVLDIVKSNKTVSQLYGKELEETMVSTSIFQDICVQMEEHHTPNRKFRQVMLELEGKLDALDAAKNGHKKAIVKLQTLKDEVEDLQEIYEELSKCNVINFDMALRLSTVSYQTKSGMDNVQVIQALPEGVLDVIARNGAVVEERFIKTILDRLKIALGNKIVDYEEAERALNASKHMIKDAAVKAYQLRQQAEIYKKQIEESGLSFDESEIIYFTIYFTAEAERQIRTGDHQVDRGTFKAISQLPEFIRMKVLKNIDYVKNKIWNQFETTKSWHPSDYIFLTERDILDPHMERDENGDLIVEGIKVKDYLKMDIIQTIKVD